MEPDSVVVTADTRFAISSRNGDMESDLQGFYAHDTRFLSAFQVTLQGKKLAPSGSGQLDHSLASFYSMNLGSRGLPAGSVSVTRDRYVGAGMHEDINLVNHSTRPRTLRLDLVFDADFADVFEVRRGSFRKAGHVSLEESDTYDLCFVYQREGFKRMTAISFTGEPVIRGHTACFELVLEPKQRWKTCVTVMPVLDQAPLPMRCVEAVLGPPFGAYRAERKTSILVLHDKRSLPITDVPELESASHHFTDAYRAAVSDLRSLRMEFLSGLPILAAGLPWFMAVFGRDSIISAIQTKLLGPELLIGTLRTLAGLQATTTDAFRDSEPGKMPHEIRVGELSVMEETPHSRYYGTADATPLFLRMLLEAYEWTGDLDLVRDLRPAAEAAIGWIDQFGDSDGDGFIEYKRGTAHGLRNQGWKDSHDSIAFADGRMAKGPIALAEVQGYAYDAKRSMSKLLMLLGDRERAEQLEVEAQRLQKTFVDAFWMADEGFFALALDGKKRPVNAIASNAGHLLWSGILEQDQAAAVVERLMAPDMFSGWGIRTLSTQMALYNPLSYHNGSVWPHDNSLIAAGMARYGFRDEAQLVATSLIEASGSFPGHRMPELFGGYPRREHSFPVPYPAANIPQAWACGAVVSFLETLLGIHVKGDKLDCYSDSRIGLKLKGVRFRGMHLEV